MNKRIGAGAAALAMVVGGGAWAALESASAAPELSPENYGWGTTSGSAEEVLADANRSGFETLVVRETEPSRARFIDVGPQGESPGDYILFENQLMNRNRTQVVGRNSGVCLLGIRTFNCQATLLLPGRGKIEVAGAFFPNASGRIPIVGGTEDFRATGGQLSFAEDNGELLVLELVE